MSLLYVEENGAVVGINGGTLTVKKQTGEVLKIPKETVDGISLFGNISMTTQCTRYCLERGIRVSYFSSSGSYSGFLHSPNYINVKRLRAQMKASENPDFCMYIGKNIIESKINNQIVLAKRYLRTSGINKDVQLNQMINSKNAINYCSSPEQIMGYEGIASRNYFDILAAVINPTFAFSGRNRRPPKDPFNSLISLGYSILTNEICGELENRGLNPYIGILHQDKEKHPTLASDMLECWRPIIIDSLVMNIIQRNEIDAKQFSISKENGGCYLTGDGLKKYLIKLEDKMRVTVKYFVGYEIEATYRKLIWHQAEKLAIAIDNNDPALYTTIVAR